MNGYPALLCVCVVVCFTAPTFADERPTAVVEGFLHGGRLAEGERALTVTLESKPNDDETRFGLGVLQFFRSVENLGRSLQRYGLRNQWNFVPFLRLPVPANPNPEMLTYAKSRELLQTFITELTRAEATLAAIRDDQVQLPLKLGDVRLNLTGGDAAQEKLIDILRRYFGGLRSVASGDELLVVFDRGDVAWVRGYCHLLMALAEIALAHDGQELFDTAAHVFFPKVETPFRFLTEKGGRGDEFVDLIALVHQIRLRVTEPERMQAALGHLEQMIVLSRESWRFLQAETDDDHEWLPNAKQRGVLGIPVTQAMIDGWHEFLNESAALLQGELLVPFWRGTEPRGVNLRRVFTEPRTFDLVLWVQGTAAAPYFEEGPRTQPAMWQRLVQVFQGQFVGFAIWFN